MSEILHVYIGNLNINNLLNLKKDVLEIHTYISYKTLVF